MKRRNAVGRGDGVVHTSCRKWFLQCCKGRKTSMLSRLLFLTAAFYAGWQYHQVVNDYNDSIHNTKKQQQQQQQQHVPRMMPSSPHDNINVVGPTTTTSHRHRRLEFINYTSSAWERMWLEHLEDWIPSDTDGKHPTSPEDSKQKACSVLLGEQMNYVRDFLNLTCTTRFPPPYQEWCRFDDYLNMPMYYYYNNNINISNNNNISFGWNLSFIPPSGSLDFEKGLQFDRTTLYPPIRPEPVIPTWRDEHIVSKFIFRDSDTGEELVEYIEPLVSHLRFPLAGCLPEEWNPFHHDDGYMLTKSYIIPPSPTLRSSSSFSSTFGSNHSFHDRYLYFDAGSSSWSRGGGGASLEYVTNMWQRHGILLDRIYAFEATTSPDWFYQSIPNLFWKHRTLYQQAYVSSDPRHDSTATPFIPQFIQQYATIDDYVIFKLDIDSPGVELGNIEFLLSNHTNHKNHSYRWIDELFWEHHVYGNPFMRKYWFPFGLPEPSVDKNSSMDHTLRGSYNYFLRLRNLGIRAHAWV